MEGGAKQKPIFFFSGDEHYYETLPAQQIRDYLGMPAERDVPAAEIFAKLQEKYDVFFLFPRKSEADRRKDIDVELRKRLEREGAKTGDIAISLMWDSKHDLDLHVIAPSGEELCFLHRKSACLGELDVDMNAGPPYSDEPVENVYWPLGKAPAGEYKVFVENFGYHKEGEAGAVLLKGQVFQAPPDLRSVQLTDTWHFASGVKFLDATAMFYDFEDNFLWHVDYRTKTTSDLSTVHSGDVMDNGAKKGSHTININLERFDPRVKAVIFTLTAWTEDLHVIIHPEVQFKNAADSTLLCTYSLEDQPTGDKTAVTMCRLFRPDQAASWQLEAVGEIGYGNVKDYTPVKADIAAYLARAAEAPPQHEADMAEEPPIDFRCSIVVNSNAEMIDGTIQGTKASSEVASFTYTGTQAYDGYADDSILAQWSQVLPKHRILSLTDSKGIVDVMLGVMAVSRGGLTLEEYHADLVERGQDDARIQEVMGILGTWWAQEVHTAVEFAPIPDKYLTEEDRLAAELAAAKATIAELKNQEVMANAPLQDLLKADLVKIASQTGDG